MRPSSRRSAREPLSVTRTVLPVPRSTHPSSVNRVHTAAPTAPARCGRRSVQSMHVLSSGRRCRSRSSTSTPRSASQRWPRLGESHAAPQRDEVAVHQRVEDGDAEPAREVVVAGATAGHRLARRDGPQRPRPCARAGLDGEGLDQLRGGRRRDPQVAVPPLPFLGEQATGDQLVEVLARGRPRDAGGRGELAGRPRGAVEQGQAHAGPGRVGQQRGQPGDRGAVRRRSHDGAPEPRGGPAGTPGDGDAEQAEGTAGEGERLGGLVEQQPGQQDRHRRHQIGRRAHPAGGRVRQRERPRRESDRGRERPEVADPRERRDARVGGLRDEGRGERQARDRADGAGQPGDLEGGEPAEQRLLGHDADRVADRRHQAEQHARRTRATAGGGRADDRHTAEGDQAADDQPGREALAEQHAGEQGEDQRPDVDEHRGRPRVDALLGGVERDVVDAEPEQAADQQQPPVPAGRPPRSADHHDGAEHETPDEQPAQRQGTG